VLNARFEWIYLSVHPDLRPGDHTGIMFGSLGKAGHYNLDSQCLSNEHLLYETLTSKDIATLCVPFKVPTNPDEAIMNVAHWH
jgi:hypothetical protein